MTDRERLQRDVDAYLARLDARVAAGEVLEAVEAAVLTIRDLADELARDPERQTVEVDREHVGCLSAGALQIALGLIAAERVTTAAAAARPTLH